MYEGRPHIGDEVMNGNIQFIVNTPKATEESKNDDSYIRKTAVKAKVPYFTTMAAAKATAEGIYTILKEGDSEVMSLQDIHAAIK
jgi:carbamoyl-phosphate synthase large subunit